ncbi:Hbt1p [Saccharomyces paradoxus]|uniref:Hbt1p n=1 Tax=Saccharomyces paradoxus TaxID=27291 RepID=A0A8B8UMS2_SACPA|nr:Hbt1 [Saccharomyces paradoxus]QHS72025.1 Hbt1 [Saccharomyces paradoxus]
MNMNESTSRDGQSEEEQNNFPFGGKPGSYDSNSNSAQRKKSFSTTKPTEYNLPKEQPESTTKNLESKAKNILLPWRKKHNKDSENSHDDADAATSRHTNVTSNVNPTSTDTKSSSGPNATVTTHGYSYVKTTTPTATTEHSKVKTSPSASHEHSNVKTSPTTHEHPKVGAGHSGVAATHAHNNAKSSTSPTAHAHSNVNAGSSGTTSTTYGHSNVKNTSPTTTHEHSKMNTGTSATATTHGHANIKKTYPVTHDHSNSSTDPKSTAATRGHSVSSSGPKSTGAAHDNSHTKTSPSTTHGHSSVKDSSLATKEYSNVDSGSDRDAMPGSFRGITGGDVNPVDPSVYTSTGPKSNVSSGMNAVDPSVYMDTSSKSTERRKTSDNTATGPPQDTIREIAQNVKMDESEQTGLKNDQISGSDVIQQQTMDPKYKGTMGTGGFVSHYNDDNKNIQYPEKNKVEKQNISERAAEKFNSERDDILESGDDYQQKNIKSKTDSNWGPIEYNTSAGKNKNLQDVVIPPSGMKDIPHNDTSVSQQKSKSDNKWGPMKYDDGKGIKDDNLQNIVGSEGGSQNANKNFDMSPRDEGQWSGVSKDKTTQNIVVPPNMKDEDLNKGSSNKPHQYGLDYLDDVEDYNENDIDDYSNAKDKNLYPGKAYQDKPTNYGYEQREEIPGSYKPDTISNSMQRQDEDPLSPRQTTHHAGMETAADEGLGSYEFSNVSGNRKLSDLSKNKSGPTPTRSNFIDQVEPRRAKTTQNITSDVKDSTNIPETGNTGSVDPGRAAVKSKTFSSNPFDDSKDVDTPSKNTNVAAFDNARTADTTTYAKSGDTKTAAYDNIGKADPTYAKSQNTPGMTYGQETPSEKMADYGSGGNSQSQEYSSDDNIDVNKNTKVLEEDAADYKHEVDLKNKRRTDIGGPNAANTYAAEVGNFPSLIDPHVPTYGFKDTDTSSSQKPSENTYPETSSYSIHNETTSQGRKVSVGSTGSGKSKHQHNHGHHHHSRQNSSKASDYDYNLSHSAEHTPRHHRYGSDEGEQDYEEEEQDEEHAGKQSFMGRVRNSISGGTFGFRSEI